MTGSWEDRLPMPPKGVLGLGLVSGGNALAGDWGLLKAELSEDGKPCMFWVCEVVELPRFRDPMADKVSICGKDGTTRQGTLKRQIHQVVIHQLHV